MPGNKCNGSANHIPGRVERLLRVREQRKNNRASHSNEATDSPRGSELFEPDLRLREDENRGVSHENGGVSHVEKHSDGSGAARLLSEESEDRRPFRQRLLVVANRLPVSAVRRGEDSWSLEISAGGLVTALLGKCWLDSCIDVWFNLMSPIA